MPTEGEIQVGDLTLRMEPESAFAVLDWGRGVWPEAFEWGWAVAAGRSEERRIGFNIGFGDGDDIYATGNALLVDGILHKLCRVEWEYSLENIMEPWRFQSADGRFEMVLEPILDQSNQMELGAYYIDMNKVHGYVTGRVELDNGEVIYIENFLGFAEHGLQSW